jgi:hypothetical protein
MWYNTPMLKAALFGALALLFLPAIKVTLCIVLATLNLIPSIF